MLTVHTGISESPWTFPQMGSDTAKRQQRLPSTLRSGYLCPWDCLRAGAGLTDA